MTININERSKNATSTTVAKVTIVDSQSGLQLYSDTLKDCNIDFTEESKEIKGGQGNTVLFAWNSDRQIVVKLTDVVSRMDWIAAKLGQTVQNGSVEVMVESKNYAVSASKVTLDATPARPSEVMIFDLTTKELIPAGKYTIAGAEVTFSGTPAPTQVQVYAYKTTITKASYLNIAHDTFAKTFEVYISIPLIEKDGNQTKTTMIKQYQFPLGQLSGGFSENTASSGEGSEYGTEIKILKPDNGSLGKMIIFNLEDLTNAQKRAIYNNTKKEVIK